MSRTAQAILSTSNLYHNIITIRQYAPQSKIIAMVKGNGYGHGIRSLSKRIEPHIDLFGVASIDEALALRQALIYKPIILMEGIFEQEELAIASEQNFQVVFHSSHQINWLNSLKPNQKLNKKRICQFNEKFQNEFCFFEIENGFDIEVKDERRVLLEVLLDCKNGKAKGSRIAPGGDLDLLISQDKNDALIQESIRIFCNNADPSSLRNTKEVLTTNIPLTKDLTSEGTKEECRDMKLSDVPSSKYSFVRACGKNDLHNLEPEDLCALTVEAAAMARVPLAGTNWIPGFDKKNILT